MQQLKTQDSQQVRDRNEQIVRKFLSLLATKQLDQWLELWADEGVQETPFAPPTFPPYIRGKAEIEQLYSNLPKIYGDTSFPGLQIYPMLDPDWVLIEYQIEAEITTSNQLYTNRYCGLFHLRDLDGKILLYKAYFNPLSFIESLGDTLSGSYKVQK